jgi:hypothetical protein
MGKIQRRKKNKQKNKSPTMRVIDKPTKVDTKLRWNPGRITGKAQGSPTRPEADNPQVHGTFLLRPVHNAIAGKSTVQYIISASLEPQPLVEGQTTSQQA